MCMPLMPGMLGEMDRGDKPRDDIFGWGFMSDELLADSDRPTTVAPASVYIVALLGIRDGSNGSAASKFTRIFIDSFGSSAGGELACTSSAELHAGPTIVPGHCKGLVLWGRKYWFWDSIDASIVDCARLVRNKCLDCGRHEGANLP